MDDHSSLEEAINEDIRLVPYDPAWPALFKLEHDRLRSIFPEAFLGVEHYGSTAVPGLSAKPIIDILAGVDSMKTAKTLVPLLCESGYTAPLEYNTGLADRQWLMRSANGHRTHHLMVVVHGDEQWYRRLAFRDKLRTDPDLASSYESLKASLASQHPRDREAYTAGKKAFINDALSTGAT